MVKAGPPVCSSVSFFIVLIFARFLACPRHLSPPDLSCRLDKCAAENTAAQKKNRELEAHVSELEEDLARECGYRAQSTQRCKDLEEELEALKTELLDTLDSTAVQQELRWGPS